MRMASLRNGELEEQRKRKGVLSMSRPISERKLQANRANAKRSTGPRTEAGRAASRKNALKHGILSRVVDLPNAVPEPDFCSLELSRPVLPEVLRRDAALKEIGRVWSKLVRVVVFERDCIQRPDGLEQNGRLINRYESMLTRQLHARIREQADLAGKH
jgi:hypothetical protein